MEIKFMDYQLKEELLNFTIKSNEINGITGNSKKSLMDIINLKNNYKGKITIDEETLSKQNSKSYKKRISIIKEELEQFYYQYKVYELMYLEIRNKELVIKNPSKKIRDSLRIVGLDTIILNRSINDLSSSEKKLLQLSLSLLSNPDTIVIEEPFKNLDKKTERRVAILLQKIKEQYNKTIVFVSDDSDMLYRYTNHLIITKNNKILLEGNTKDLYKRVDFLKKNKISIPNLVEFTYLVKKKKNIKIDYHKDIRDIIKDIYKHV